MLRKIAIVALIGLSSLSAHAKKDWDQFLYDFKRSNYNNKEVKTEKYEIRLYEHVKDSSDLRLSHFRRLNLINSIEVIVNANERDFNFACTYQITDDSLKMKIVIKKDVITDLDSFKIGDTAYKFSDLQNPPKFKNKFISNVGENASSEIKKEMETLINDALENSSDKSEVVVDLKPDHLKPFCYIAKNGLSLQAVVSYQKSEDMFKRVIEQNDFLKLYDAFWDLSEKRSNKNDEKFAQNVLAGVALHDENLHKLELYSGTRLTDLVEAISTQKRIRLSDTNGEEELEKRWKITKEYIVPETKYQVIDMRVSIVKPNVRTKLIFKQ